jgi:hypothetical protein
MTDEPPGPRPSVHAIRCAFCGKPRNQVASLVAGPTPEVAICNECVALCAEIVSEDSTPPPPDGQAA